MGSWRSGGTPLPPPPGFPRPFPFGGLRSSRTGQMRGPFSSPPPQVRRAAPRPAPPPAPCPGWHRVMPRGTPRASGHSETLFDAEKQTVVVLGDGKPWPSRADED